MLYCVQDSGTNLMWAAKDNGSRISWEDAKNYCENYRGGGYSDWRMPTTKELSGLYNPAAKQRNKEFHLTELIDLTDCCPWTAVTSHSNAETFNFFLGEVRWIPRSYSPSYTTVLPVRSVK